jgi:DNA polymerase III alpha subunit
LIYQEQVMQAAQVLAGYTLGAPTCCAAPWAKRKSEEMARAARELRQGLRQGQQYSRRQGQPDF